MSEDWRFPQHTLVDFGISAPNLDPDIVTRVLELTPDHQHLAGDFPRGNAKYSAYKNGLWSIRSPVAPERPLSEHLESLLEILEPRQAQIRQLSQDAKLHFFCSLFAQGGLELSAILMRRIATLGASFGADVYPPDSEIEK